MMAFLQFTFAGFWHFAGVALLLMIVVEGLASGVRAGRGKMGE